MAQTAVFKHIDSGNSIPSDSTKLDLTNQIRRCWTWLIKFNVVGLEYSEWLLNPTSFNKDLKWYALWTLDSTTTVVIFFGDSAGSFGAPWYILQFTTHLNTLCLSDLHERFCTILLIPICVWYICSNMQKLVRAVNGFDYIGYSVVSLFSRECTSSYLLWGVLDHVWRMPVVR